MTAAFSMLRRVDRRRVFVHGEIFEAKKDDARAVIEPDFHQRVSARGARNDGVDAPCLAGARMMNRLEVRRRRKPVDDGDGSAYQHIGSRTLRRRLRDGRGLLGLRGVVGIHGRTLTSGA